MEVSWRLTVESSGLEPLIENPRPVLEGIWEKQLYFGKNLAEYRVVGLYRGGKLTLFPIKIQYLMTENWASTQLATWCVDAINVMPNTLRYDCAKP